MAILKVEVPVSKEAYELSVALLKMILEIRKHLADGAGVDDVPKLIELLMSSEVVEGVKGLDQLDDEIKENTEAFINAFATLGSALVKEYSKK